MRAPVIHSLDDLYQRKPAMVVFAASLDILSENQLIDLGWYFHANEYYPALGINTGSTLQKARELWNRGGQVSPGPFYLVSDNDQYGGINRGFILRIDREPMTETALTRENLIRSLQTASCLYWARHVSKKRWFWHTGTGGEEDCSLYAQDLPRMGPAVIYTPSCGFF